MNTLQLLSYSISILALYAQNHTKLKYSGMTFTNERYCPNISMDSDVGYDSLKHMATTGTNYVAIVVTQYQMNISSTTIFPVFNEPIPCSVTPSGVCLTATNASLIQTITNAHNLGMKVFLRAYVNLVADPKHWTGDIGKFFNDSQWNLWFMEYTKFILGYAELAQQNNVEMFSVSGELVDASKQEKYWRELIPKIRSVYDGILTSSANWALPNGTGEVTEKQWWDLMDIIGVDEYYVATNYQFVNGSYPTLDELKIYWQPIEQQLIDLSIKWNKSVIFTECGYCSGVNGTCYSNGMIPPSPPTNESMQAMVTQYQATLEVMTKYEWFEGVFWWNWARYL